ncbi:MAG: hypothetical protein A3G33_03275 [Omnitrophica bacterium RIFCSPLOWO2_12_FULL_44_17]|uniref:Glycosyltransferase 2-like domain-containing protein n=1 Tax=Candidatus Danuiimicrobium aquiferis TaxID=1801832 RepID=A0A1G1KTU3_9BACT|nr:MAG: hypothetical protein A3B72_06820 [Omnitrophica bacterium RIFCSPHIGHO2_02_FULL_45_28]OGW90057.1 MAG: hypothetical protein A3E74_08160 [Omnitrophica bacterium RIFCSPHIGHO2_12_FULL_44_12]OGW96341.1 MAG: hypothetical protein A3G33_03275 [Omnitrophica bacterium RIFCSPLOWO2_12_FULL_44_17]OGX04850.1 MAG: hypothetical protein A3J12_07855 [Omnitrophica bacterium RIFCSPLOWO2_02_FULL_44_11]
MKPSKPNQKIIVMMPAYNVATVLEKTITDIPKDWVDEILVINDGSTDSTKEVAEKCGVSVVSHPKSRGYGAVQKTGYREAIQRGADIVVMVHGDYQYDPTLVPQFVWRISHEGFDVVTGTRMVLGDVLKKGMPMWKFIPNRLLTWLENYVFKTNISDYHNGYRAFRADFLKQVNLDLLSDKFDFDTDIMIQAAIRHAKIAEIPHPTRYEDENSQMPFGKAVRYGIGIMATVIRYVLHKMGIRKSKRFEVANHG